MPAKPPYRVPSMEEVRALPWNGFNAVSTFSGGGGSSTGYRMAGFRVRWANEMVESARDTYRANMAPDTVLDGRDIRQVRPEDILGATGLAEGEIDLFDGSPPCDPFSTAGKREAQWGKVKPYLGKAQRTDDLFYEYARLIRGTKPRAFVAENVSGLVKGSAKGYFLRILAELKGRGYRVEAKLLDAQWLGVPQARQRLIFVGVREDLGRVPAFPAPLPHRYTVRDALPHIMRVVHDTSGTWGKGDVTDSPCPTITVGVNAVNSYHFRVEREADMTGYAVGAEWDNLAPCEQSSKYFNLVRAHPDRPSPTVTAAGGAASTASVSHPVKRRKFSIAELKRVCAFPDDYVLCGTYEQQWTRCGMSVPPVMMKAIAESVRDRVLVLARAAGRI